MTENKENVVKSITIISLMSLALVLLSDFLNISLYLLIPVIIFFATMLFRLEYGIYLIAFFLPVINWNFEYVGLRVPFIDLLAVSVFFMYFIQKFLARKYRDIDLVHLFSFSFFFLAAILSSIFSDNIFSSLWYSLRWILFFYLVYIVLPVNVIKSEKILKNTLIFFSFSVLLVSLMGVFSIFSQDWIHTLARAKPISIFGIFLIGENQNLMAETLLPGIFILVSLKYWTKEKVVRRFLNLLILFVGIVLLLTFSRGAWLSLFVVSFFSALVYYKSKFIKFLMPLFLILIITIPLILYMVNLQANYGIGTSSNQSRILLSEIAWNGFKNNSILGKGTGEYFNIVAQNIRFRANYGAPVDSHGVGQKILVENGALGIFAFIIFIFAIYKKFFSIFKDRKFIEIYLPLIGAASSIFIFELFNTSYYKGKLWFVVALALVSIKLIQDKKIYEK